MSKNIDAQQSNNDAYVSVAAPVKSAAQKNKLVTCFGVSKHPKEHIGYDTRFSCGETATVRANHLQSNQCLHTKVALYQMSTPCTQLVAAHVLLNDMPYISDIRAGDACFTLEHQAALNRFIAKHSQGDINDAIEQAKGIKIAGR